MSIRDDANNAIADLTAGLNDQDAARVRSHMADAAKYALQATTANPVDAEKLNRLAGMETASASFILARVATERGDAAFNALLNIVTRLIVGVG